MKHINNILFRNLKSYLKIQKSCFTSNNINNNISTLSNIEINQSKKNINSKSNSEVYNININDLNLNTKDIHKTNVAKTNADDILENIYTASTEDILNIIKLELNEYNSNINKFNINRWSKIITRINDLLCNKQLKKADLLDILELLNYIQPKIIQKEFPHLSSKGPFSVNQLSVRHEEELEKMQVNPNILFAFMLHIKNSFKLAFANSVINEAISSKKNFNQNLGKVYKTVYDKDDYIDEKLDDLIGSYITLFENIEKKVTDDIIHGRVDYNFIECIMFIQSFSRAKEGTNLFYEVMMRKISKNLDSYLLSAEQSNEHLQEVITTLEVLLNTLPHDLYKIEHGKLELELHDLGAFSEEGITENIDSFYISVITFIMTKLSIVSDQQFNKLFQGLMRVSYIDENIVNAFLSEFDYRANQKFKENNELSIKNNEYLRDKSFYFDFLQILTYFIKSNQSYLEIIDFNILFSSIDKSFLSNPVYNSISKDNMIIKKFSIKEIATIFWIAYHLNTLNKDLVDKFSSIIENSVNLYLNDPKPNINNVGFGNVSRYYEIYNLEKYDMEAIDYFINCINYKTNLNKLIKNALKIINLEDTHPISRNNLF